MKDNRYSSSLRSGGRDVNVAVRNLAVQKRHGQSVTGIEDIVAVAGDVALQHGLRPYGGIVIFPPRIRTSPEADPALRRQAE